MRKQLRRRVAALSVTLALTLAFLLAMPASALFGREAAEPTGVTAFSKNGPITGTISFSTDDFQVSGDGELSSIIVTSLPDPTAGVLTVAGQLVSEGSEIAMNAISALQFNPLLDPSLTSTSFTFTPVFDRGLMGEAVTVGLFLLQNENAAPVAEELKLTTYKNVEVQGTFAGVDPEGDLLTFRLVSKPARGTVTQEQEGSANFTYTPYENKTGKDAFTYVAVDAVGNTSAPVTVSIKIEKQKTKVTYSDMTGVEGHREAVRLAEAGLLVGEKMGDQYFFRPTETMSRAQFTALVLAAAGIDALEGVTVTGFADDEVMATWAKPYVSAALLAGVVQGNYGDNGQIVFRADASITTAEAAVLLDRALNVTDVHDVSSVMAVSPAWCVQAVANLSSCGALPASAVISEPLTRAQAAIMIDRALTLIENRQSSSWLPWK